VKYLTFRIRDQLICEDGSRFSWTFSEDCYFMADAPHTIVDGQVVVYTPENLIERAVRTFFSGLTLHEQVQTWTTLEIEARQVGEFDALSY
jgi:hypothetical protein